MQLIVRDKPTLKGNRLGYANKGIYNLTEKVSADDYTWYKLNNSIYAPNKDNWVVEHKAKIKEEIIEKPSDPVIEEPIEKEEPIIVEPPKEEPIEELPEIEKPIEIEKPNFLEVIKDLIKWFIGLFRKEK